MALVIAVSLLKGGVGKTTTAVALAEAAALSVPTVILDMDPQGGAIRWAELAEAAGRPLRAEARPMAVDGLADRMRGIPAECIIIDTPPPGALPRVHEAVSVADAVVIPCPPQLADLDRVPPTMAIAAEHRTPAAVTLTMVRGGIEDSAIAAVTLRSWEVPVYDATMPLTVAVQRAYGQPLTSGPLLRFGIDLLTEVLKERT